MKRYLFIGVLMLTFSSCKRECMKNQEAACLEQAPDGTTCMAYWESWVYNPETDNCEFKGYSGCSPIGFDTEAACEDCECHN